MTDASSHSLMARGAGLGAVSRLMPETVGLTTTPGAARLSFSS
jgi:hypothetical protein